MLKKVYIEITNQCNLNCAFCPGTERKARSMTPEEFAHILVALEGKTEYIYLHVMGEPLLHPQLAELLRLAGERRMKVCITTNGTMLPERKETLLAARTLHKVSVSLHSYEGNALALEQQRTYLENVWDFSACAATSGIIIALRLWNEDGLEKQNALIFDFLRKKVPKDWPELRSGSFRLGDNLYLERAKQFDWPALTACAVQTQFCYGLRDQIGVLADGTVVPCCLDHEGDIPLGNLFKQSFEEIWQSARAAALREGFSRREPVEELCRRCGYALRFNK